MSAIPDATRGRPLTEREADVLRGMAEGGSNADIGRALFISEDTVKTHARRLFAKLGAKDRANAVALGFRMGLITADPLPSPGAPPVPVPEPVPPAPVSTAERLARAGRLLAVCRDTEAAKGNLALSLALRTLTAAVGRVTVDARTGRS